MRRLLMTGLGAILALAAVASAQPGWRPTLAELEKRAVGLLPAPEMLRFQEIPWIHDLAEARKIARQEHRPLFLWGYGGRARPDNGLEGC